MHRIAILGVFLLIAAPLAARETPALFDRLTLKAELDDLASGIQGLSAAEISADPARRELMIEELALQRPGLALRIGHLTLRLPAPRAVFAGEGMLPEAAAANDAGSQHPAKDARPARPQAGSISADDIVIDTDMIHSTIKHIDIEGTRLGKADLVALFDAQAPTSAAERIAKLSAAHVAISEIVLQAKLAAQAAQDKTADQGADEKIVLRDIAMDDLAQGHAGLVVVGATSVIMHSPEAGETQAAFGPTRITGLDLAQAARLFSAADSAATKAQRLCGSLDIEGVKISAPKAQAQMGMGTLAIKDVRARSLQQLLPSGDRLGAEPPAPERATAFAHVFDGFDIGSLEFTDLRFAIPKGAAPWTGKIERGYATRIDASEIAEAGGENFTIAADGAKVKIARFGWRGADPTAAKESKTKSVPDKVVPNAAALPADQQKLTADRLDIDLSNLESYQTPPGAPTHFQLGHFELTSSDSVDGAPTRMAAAFDHLIFAIDGMKDGYFAEIAALGYGKLDLSSRLAAHYNDANGELGLDALSLSGIDMGSVQISGRFDHFTKALFSPDQAEIEAGLLGVLLRRIEVRVENAGLFERLVETAAKKSDTSPAEIRKSFMDAVTAVVPALLGNGHSADVVGAALAKFIAKPKNFRLAVTAPNGIGVLEVALIKDPAILLQHVEIDVAADE